MDPAAGPVQQFANELRKLRQETGGMPYRAMAKDAQYSAATLAQAAAGRKLPSLPVLLAYVAACGGDLGEWESHWREVAEQDQARPLTDDGAAAPYLGLRRFQPEDADRFYGRDELTDDLIALVRAHALVAVVGASGSGKSSLLRAGLIPALRNGPPSQERPAAIRILTPGAHPLRTHTDVFTPVDGDADTVVAIDQFEELFTLCRHPEERSGFLDLLLTACRPGSRLRVVLAVRADFIGHCAGHRGLAEALRSATVLVGPMTTAELREAIVKPAAGVGLIVERSLTTRILKDLADEPGGLPLMSHALLETWRRRRGRALTVAAYEAAGGIHRAIAQSAEDLYGHLTPVQAQAARRILLRLIAPGEDTPDTRRPAARAEFAATGLNAAEISAVLERLVRARLVTLDGTMVNLAHETLINAWARLRGWIEKDRHSLRVQRQLAEAVSVWEGLERDAGALYRGARLAEAEEVFGPAGRPEDLTPAERDFLTTSRRARDRERRRLWHLLTAVTMAVCLALIATGTVWWQQHQADIAQLVTQSQHLAAQSTALLGADPELSSLLAVHAYRIRATPEATASLYAAADVASKRRLVHGNGYGFEETVTALAVSPDGHTLAASTHDDTVRLWDVATGKILKTFSHRYLTVKAMSFSADGRTLVVGGDQDGGTARAWDVATGTVLWTVNPAVDANNEDGMGAPVAFSPDARTMFVSEGRGPVYMWDLGSGRKRTLAGSPTGTGWPTVAVSPDGRTLAVGNSEGPLQLWDVTGGRIRQTPAGTAGLAQSLAFSPDSRTLATGSSSGAVALWDVATAKPKSTLTSGPEAAARSLAFSPYGRFLAVGSDDATIREWDVDAGKVRNTLGGHGPATSATYSRDGGILATGGEGVCVWDTTAHRFKEMPGQPGPLYLELSPRDGLLAAVDETGAVELRSLVTGRLRHVLSLADGPSAVWKLAFNAEDGSVAAIGETGNVPGAEGTVVRVWDVATGKVRRTLTNPGFRAMGGLAFSPDGRFLSVGDGVGTTRIWDTTTGKERSHLRAGGRAEGTMAFSREGHFLAAVSVDGAAQVWNVATGKIERSLPALSDLPGWKMGMAFSPDGRLLAAGGRDGVIRIWHLPTGQLLDVLVGNHSGQIMEFSPDGRVLAVAGLGNTVQVWDVDTGRVRLTLTSPSAIETLAFHPDGGTLTAAGPQTAGSWKLDLPDPRQAIDKICRSAARNLDLNERAHYLPDGAQETACPDR